MLRQRAISSVGVVLAAAIPAFIGGPFFWLALLIIATIGVHEALAALHQGGYRPFRRLSYLTVAALISGSYWWSFEQAASVLVVSAVIVMLIAGVVRTSPDGGLRDWSASLTVSLYIGLSLSAAIALRNLTGLSDREWINRLSEFLGSADTAVGLSWIGLVFAATWLTDTAAYLGGRRFGRTRLVPHLSPGKTREGALSGTIAGTLAGIAAATLFGTPISPVAAGAVGFILAIAAQLGDLGESLIKRNLGVKDMGTLIPGHGGVMDRIDALLFTMPLTYLFAVVLTKLGWL